MRFASVLLFFCSTVLAAEQAAVDPQPRAMLPPSSNFDLTHWYLTLPSADNVMPVVLNSGYQYADVFYTDPRNGGMVFRCPNVAGHTATSHYSRTELREMLAPDDSNLASPANNWTTSIGGTMTATLRVDQVSTTGDPGKVGNVIIGQIHGPNTEVVRLHYRKLPGEAKGRIYAAMEDLSGHGVHSPDIVGNADGDGIALGERFSYTIKLVGRRLTVSVQHGGVASRYINTIAAGYVGLNLYFKAGVYNQNNTGDAADYVQATFFKLIHTHP